MIDLKEGLTFDDVLIVPQKSEVIPSDVEIKTRLTKKISISMPLVSSPMDTVTESATAIRMAEEGGIGIIHKNLSPQKQAAEVRKVKKYESFMIENPITMKPEDKIEDVIATMKKTRIGGVPIVKDTKLVGILTNRDLRFETNFDEKVGNVMTKDNLVTVKENVTRDEAKKLLHKHRIEKLLVVDDNYCLKGLITIKDIQKAEKFPNASKDKYGRLLVGAAVGVGADREERIAALVKAKVDVLIVDTAHGHSTNVIETVKFIKSTYPKVELIAGNVATESGAKDLIAAGVDAIKVGLGPGSICTTRVVAGVGVPQISAIFSCQGVCKKNDVPLIADGGIKYSGDIAKAIAAGADTVMIGSLFAGTDESPGDLVLYQGRSYKSYRGMGSLGAMKEGSKDRYFQEGINEGQKLVPEGIEGRIPYRGPLSNVVYQLIGGLRSGMGYSGAKNILELKTKTKFLKISGAGITESHVHDVIITKEAPNYRVG